MATDIKSKVWLAQAIPATATLTAFQALSWVQIKGVVSIGSFGFAHAMIEVPDLETGVTIQEKGAETGQAGPIAFREISGDAGQADVAESVASREWVSLRVDDPTGGKARFYMGHIHSLIPNEGSVTSYKGSTCQFTPNAYPIYGSAVSGG